PHLPVTQRIFLPDRAGLFLQSSKSHHVPQNYIALVGDSYVQGLGDWLFQLGAQTSKPYHSGDVIHEILGRDVVEIGRAGQGSAESLVLRVTRIFDDSYCYLFPSIGEPAQFLIYFYEGNDIDDNIRLLEHRIQPSDSNVAPAIDRFLNENYGAF